MADATSSIPWIPLTLLFDAFADIRGVGFSKMTKALHRKRPALIPMLRRELKAGGRMCNPGRKVHWPRGAPQAPRILITDEPW